MPCDGTWTHQLGVSTVVQYEVLRLQVSVYDAFGMQVGEGFHHTAGVEAGGGVLERAPETQGEVCVCYRLFWSQIRCPDFL